MYETLAEMGIVDTGEIEKYTMRQEGDEDILKVYFKRKKGEFFSHSMKFRHGRSKKMVLVDGGSHEYKEVSEISPVMQKAAEELDRIVDQENTIADAKKRILSDIDHLDRVIQRKLKQLREDVDLLR
ncbi:MAG: DUF3461 family protein [Gammaproteobacteria bacterium]|nr:DUF3461 family protein [Gammaproteobacteria bacterium]